MYRRRKTDLRRSSQQHSIACWVASGLLGNVGWVKDADDPERMRDFRRFDITFGSLTSLPVRRSRARPSRFGRCRVLYRRIDAPWTR